MELSPSQAFALDDIVEKRKSGFLSGAGGTGKSFMIEQIVTLLQDKKVCTCLTATTGIAAVIIGGVTLHSKFRLLPDEKDAKQCVKRVKDNSKFADELASIQCLIVDEVSIVLFSLETITSILTHIPLFCRYPCWMWTRLRRWMP